LHRIAITRGFDDFRRAPGAASRPYGLIKTTGPFTALTHEHHVGERMLSCGRPMFGARSGRSYEIGAICDQGEA